MTTMPPPPVEPGELDLREPASWPKVVGIISIILAVLGIGCGGCGVAGNALQKFAASMAPPEMGQMPAAMMMGPLQIGHAVLGVAWAILLLTAGIYCVLRKPLAKPLHLVYAIGAFVLMVVFVVLAIVQQAAIAEALKADPGNPWLKQSRPEFAWLGIGFGILLGSAWPVFCLIWFGIVKRDSRDLDGGASQL